MLPMDESFPMYPTKLNSSNALRGISETRVWKVETVSRQKRVGEQNILYGARLFTTE